MTSRYWVLLYDHVLDRQIRVYREALTLEGAKEAAEIGNPGMHVIAAGLAVPTPGVWEGLDG